MEPKFKYVPTPLEKKAVLQACRAIRAAAKAINKCADLLEGQPEAGEQLREYARCLNTSAAKAVKEVSK